MAVNFTLSIIRRNFPLAPNQGIRMVSEESCDIEDWVNGAEHIFFITGII